VQSLRESYDVLYDASLFHREPQLVEAAAEARALIVRNQTQVRGPVLAACRRLEAVGRLGVGLDNIDLVECKRRDIAVLPATGANDVSVAEYVIAGILMLLRGSFFSTSLVADGTWPRIALVGREASGRTLGLVGFGNIARQVAARAGALGMRIIAHDPLIPAEDPVWHEHRAAPRPLEGLLAESDVVSLHVPLTPTTRGLMGGRRIAAMRRGAVLVNTSRGGVVDEAALADALRTKALGGAMLDVFATEPLPRDNPFHGVPNLVLTPHIAGVTEESNERVGALTAANVRRILEARR
jgi:(S)-sulfolactate dehydrogenase